MTTIALPGPKILFTIHGKEVLISPEDYEKCSSMRWSHDPKGYVRSTKSGKTLLLHRFLIQDVPDGFCVDHINHNKSDNRRENLRVVTLRENNLNHTGNSRNISGIPGVQFHKATQKWRAYTYFLKKQKHLGLFDSFEDAVCARVKALREMGGLV